MPDAFAADTFLIRQKVFTFLHRNFHVYDAAGTLVLYSRMKGFKLREDIRLYADESMGQELLSIQARSIIDFSAAYDVIDVPTGRRLGVLRRKGFSSMLRDSWEVLSPDETPLGTVIEDSMLKALVRRFVDAASFFMPQTFHVDLAGQRAASYTQNFNPFVRKLNVAFEPHATVPLDHRLGLAIGVLLMAIEGRQN